MSPSKERNIQSLVLHHKIINSYLVTHNDVIGDDSFVVIWNTLYAVLSIVHLYSDKCSVNFKFSEVRNKPVFI